MASERLYLPTLAKSSSTPRRCPQPAQLAVERLARDPETPRRRGLRRERIESLPDQRELDAGQQGRERRRVGQAPRHVTDRRCQMMRADALVVGDREDEAMHLVLQLAHVAGPAM